MSNRIHWSEDCGMALTPCNLRLPFVLMAKTGVDFPRRVVYFLSIIFISMRFTSTISACRGGFPPFAPSFLTCKIEQGKLSSGL